MDSDIKNKFITLWKRYFTDTELPITFYYTNKEDDGELVKSNSASRCIIGTLQSVRKGHSLCFSIDSIGCPGGRRYLGFTKEIMPDFEYFLSCGIAGKREGERYKKSPELVKEFLTLLPAFKAPGEFIVFKRWDMLAESDNPDVVIFFAKPDVLSGLFTLANFDEAEPNAVCAPFGSGCSTIVQYPYSEKESNRPRGVIGMFDISARPYVPQNILTFSVPINKFMRMFENMEESFLLTKSWTNVEKRINLV